MGLRRAQGKKFLQDANILQQNGDSTRDLTIFVSCFLHCLGFICIEICGFNAFGFLAFSFSIDFKPGWPFKKWDLLRFVSDLISFFLTSQTSWYPFIHSVTSSQSTVELSNFSSLCIHRQVTMIKVESCFERFFPWISPGLDFYTSW